MSVGFVRRAAVVSQGCRRRDLRGRLCCVCVCVVNVYRREPANVFPEMATSLFVTDEFVEGAFSWALFVCPVAGLRPPVRGTPAPPDARPRLITPIPQALAARSWCRAHIAYADGRGCGAPRPGPTPRWSRTAPSSCARPGRSSRRRDRWSCGTLGPGTARAHLSTPSLPSCACTRVRVPHVACSCCDVWGVRTAFG